MWVPVEARDIGSTGVTEDCEPPDMAAEPSLQPRPVLSLTVTALEDYWWAMLNDSPSLGFV